MSDAAICVCVVFGVLDLFVVSYLIPHVPMLPILIRYCRYATTLVASTIMNGYLISLGWDKNVAFWGTICGFGVINYLLLTLVVTGDDDGGGADKANRIPRGGEGCSVNPKAAFVGNERRRRRSWICFTSADDLNSTRAVVPDL